MEIIPAIDIRNGKCVRLRQGKYDLETIFDNDPVLVAKKWEQAGARRLHIIDLDGARDGRRKNAEVVNSIVKSVGIPIQLGGGIRTAKDASELIKLGVDRIIFGTAAVESPQEIHKSKEIIGTEKIIVGIDANQNNVRVRGWLEDSGLTIIELVKKMESLGIKRFMYTDVNRDGMLTHPNFDSIHSLVTNIQHPIVAAGGISSVEDLLKLADIGVESSVIGTAIYLGALDLKQAITIVDKHCLKD